MPNIFPRGWWRRPPYGGGHQSPHSHEPFAAVWPAKTFFGRIQQVAYSFDGETIRLGVIGARSAA